MFKSLGKLVGRGGESKPPPQPFEVAPPNPENPVVVPCFTPFPLTGEKIPHNGYMYTTPSDMDFSTFRAFLDTPEGWTLRYEKDGMYSWDRSVPGEAMRLIKAFGIFEGVTPAQLNDLIQDPDYRIDWDANRLDGFCFTHLTDRCDVGYYAAKVQKPVSNRDFVNMRSWRIMDNGDYVIMSTSVPVAEMPPKAGLVRAIVKVSGYLIRPFGDGSCSLTYLSQSDPKGWLPSYFVNTLTCKLAPNVINSMRKALAKYPEWIAGRGNRYDRPWLVSETQWQLPVTNQLHDWVMERAAKGGAAPPPEQEDLGPDATETSDEAQSPK